MPRITMIFGVLLILLGVGVYQYLNLQGEDVSKTALIPGIPGVLLALLGLMGTNPGLRKLAMHIAMVVALLGVLAFGGLIPRMGEMSALAIGQSAAMSGLCLILFVMGIASFVKARQEPAADGGSGEQSPAETSERAMNEADDEADGSADSAGGSGNGNGNGGGSGSGGGQ